MENCELYAQISRIQTGEDNITDESNMKAGEANASA
jgi:hypothetical protein